MLLCIVMRFQGSFSLTAYILFLLIFPFLIIASEILIIDDFSYPSDQEARAVWQAGTGYPEVEIGMDEDEYYMQTPINYQQDHDRHWWDGYLSPDLTTKDRFVIDVYIPDLGIMYYFTLYLHCGTTNDWVGASAGIDQTGRRLWSFEKEDFSAPESFDWSNIDRIRLSPWKNQEGSTYLRFYEIYAYSPDIYVVEGTQSHFHDTARDMAEQMYSLLSRWNISIGLITDIDVENGRLEGADLAIYPYNDNVSDEEIAQLQTFVEEGGKLMAFYNLKSDVADLLGIDNVGWVQEQYEGQFYSYVFETENITALPERVLQDSWNIRNVSPSREDARVIAWWENEQGDKINYPAWTLSDTGAFKSHIILQDDPENTEKALLALVGHLRPQSWQEMVQGAYENIGRIAYYGSYSQAVADIEEAAVSAPRRNEVKMFLEEADSLRNSAITLFDQGRYDQALEKALAARESLLEAYYRVQTGKRGEFRAIWEHAGTGIKPGDWEYSAALLSNAGFNAVIPNLLWGGSAHYDSEYLLPSDEFLEYGDQVAQAVEAAHNVGLSLHAWKVHWRIHRAPQEWQQQMSDQGRLQKSIEGIESTWLCPSHPENQQLELNSMLEIVQNYDVDGVHLDYIRYQNEDYCFCNGCRQRFEEYFGESVSNWPQDCYSGDLKEEYYNWRASNITWLVRSIYEEAKALDPDILISAAVFANHESALAINGQDWVSWCTEGYLDFVCPMNYTTNYDRFKRLLSRQIEVLDGCIPMYPGIGGHVLSADEIIAQIDTVREYELPGFVLFNFDAGAAENILPALEKGITKDPVSSAESFRLFE